MLSVLNSPLDFEGRGTARGAVEGSFRTEEAPPPAFGRSPSPAKTGEDLAGDQRLGASAGLTGVVPSGACSGSGVAVPAGLGAALASSPGAGVPAGLLWS